MFTRPIRRPPRRHEWVHAYDPACADCRIQAGAAAGHHVSQKRSGVGRIVKDRRRQFLDVAFQIGFGNRLRIGRRRFPRLCPGQGIVAGSETQRDDIMRVLLKTDGLRDRRQHGIVAPGDRAIPVTPRTTRKRGRPIEIVHRRVGGGVNRLGQRHFTSSPASPGRAIHNPGAEECGTVPVIVERHYHGVDALLAIGPEDVCNRFRQGKLPALYQNPFESGQFLLRRILGPNADRPMEHLVQNRFGLGEHCLSLSLGVKEVQDLLESEVLDQAPKHNASRRSSRRSRSKWLSTSCPAGVASIQSTQGLHLDEGPTASAIE